MIVFCYYTILTLFIILVWQYHPFQAWSDSSYALTGISSTSWTVWTGKYPESFQDLPITNRKQHGYFLHITDMHVDEEYVQGGTVKSACHRTPDRYGSKLGGKYGAPGEQCDAPVRLAQETLDWISRKYKDKLDFIIWTGDNAKHDWDKKHKRKRKHVYELNQRVTDMMIDTFWIKDKIPVIPSFGNNDVFPHNECSGNDKDLLNFYERLFRAWIPVEQRSTFRNGGYYIVKVAPRLNVLSLNSLFFYTKNTEAKHCLKWDSPGAIQLQWFIEQLKRVRKNNEKVYVIGHVPPSPRDYKASCLTEYLRIALSYQDVILGHFFAHLNMDHFLMFDYTDTVATRQYKSLEQDDHLFHTARNTDEYMGWLRDMYTTIDPSGDKSGSPGNHPPLVVIQVAPSILPVYNPSFRIYQYEINPDETLHKNDDDNDDDDDDNDDNDDTRPYGTLLGYTQYYANITKWNNIYSTDPIEYELEYTTNEAYGMEDLTVGSYFELASNMLQNTTRGNQLWSAYQTHMLIRTQNFTL